MGGEGEDDAPSSGEQERVEAGAEEAPPLDSARDSMEIDLAEQEAGAEEDLSAPA